MFAVTRSVVPRIAFALMLAAAIAPAQDLTKLQVFKPGEETLTRYIRIRSRIRSFQSDGHLVGGKVKVTHFSGDLGGGRIQFNGNLDWTNKTGQQTARVTLQNVDSRQFLSAFNLDFDARIVTRVNADVSVKWQGISMPDLRRSMNGSMSMRTGRGRVDKSTVFDALAEATGIQDLRSVDFESCAGDGEVRNGVLYFENARINGDFVRLLAAGKVDVPSDSIEIEVHLAILPELAMRSARADVRTVGALLAQAKSLQDQDGFVQLPVPVYLTGTFTKPHASVAGITFEVPEGNKEKR